MHLSASDTSRASRKVVQALPRHVRPRHLTGNLLDRHCAEIRSRIDGISWPTLKEIKEEGQPAIERAMESIADLREVLQDPDAFSHHDEAYCYIHKTNCPASLEGLLRELAEERDVPVSELRGEKGPLTIMSGGITCTDHSVIGQKAGIAGPSTMPMLSFLKEVEADKPDCLIAEWAPGAPAEIIETEVSRRSVDKTKLCPSEIGVGIFRKRLYMASTDERHDFLMGMREFFDLFSCQRVLDGHSFFAESQATIEEKFATEVALLEKELGLNLRSGQWKVKHMDFEALLDYSRRSRLKRCREIHAERLAKKQKCSTTPLFGACSSSLLADLDHDPDSRERVSSSDKVPGLLKHGCLWSDEANCGMGRSATVNEFLSMQGYPSIPEAHGDLFEVPWLADADLSPCEIKALAGNAMHIHVFFIVVLWFMSCVVPGTETK